MEKVETSVVVDIPVHEICKRLEDDRKALVTRIRTFAERAFVCVPGPYESNSAANLVERPAALAAGGLNDTEIFSRSPTDAVCGWQLATRGKAMLKQYGGL